jgi:chromosome segregation ATPase
MKRLITFFLLSFAFLILISSQTIAQSMNPGAGRSQEQSLQDLVNEVRQLRVLLQRINFTVYKTNVVVERLKFQQEVVTRLSRELNDVRENLSDTRSQISKMKELIPRLEKGVETGTRSPDELTGLKLELENATEREMRFVQRETQLMNDLSIERSKLLELNDQLNKLELDLTAR